MAKHKGRLIKNAIQDMESVMRPEVVDQVNREVEKQLSHTRQTTSAQSAEQREEDFAPAVDPITGDPLFMWIDHPERGMVPTYGGPFDSYTLCERDIDESNSDEVRFYRERFDHDEGAWVDGCESVGFSLITQDRLISLEDSLARLASKPSRDETPDANDDILNRIIFDAQSWLTRSMDGEHDEVVPAYSDAEIKRRLIAWARPSREEEMRERAKVREECAQILRDDAETLERNGMAQKAHGLKRGALLILELNTQERAALAQGGARDEAPKDEGKEGAK